MSISLTHAAPRSIIAGDTIEFLVSIPSDYLTWTGSARLSGLASMDATSCVTEGSDFHVKFQGLGTTGTSALVAGQYTLGVWATNENDRATVALYPLTITANIASGSPTQQHALVMLPIIEAAIQARITGNKDGGLESYTVDGTQVMKLPMEQLQKLRRQYAAEVASLQGTGGIRKLPFAFTPAGGITGMRGRHF